MAAGGEARVSDGAPDGGLGEASVGLALAEDVEVAAGAELGEEAGPAVPFRDAVEAGQERVVDGLQDLPLRAGAAFLVPPLQLLPVHHLGRHHHRRCRRRRRVLLLLRVRLVAGGGWPDLGQVHAANVPRAEAAQEPDVGEGYGAEARDLRRGERGGGGGGGGGGAARRRGREGEVVVEWA